MDTQNKKYISLLLWILGLTAIGSTIGSLTKAEISHWYSLLKLSPLTPPNYVFPIVWTILYIMIGVCGHLIWENTQIQESKLLKILYLAQLVLNWAWTPIFFTLHLTGFSLSCVLVLSIVVFMIIYFSFRRIKLVSLLMVPYMLWSLFATYLNFYIWWFN
jgi:benzodiazapine receptor